MELKIMGSKGRTVDVSPGVTLRITSEKLVSKDLRKEVSNMLSETVPKLVEKILGEQTTVEEHDDEAGGTPEGKKYAETVRKKVTKK